MRSLARSACLGFSLLLMLAFGACSSGADQSTTAYPPLILHYAVDRYEFTTPARMCSSMLTAEVVVGSHGPSFWNTANGLRPQVTDPPKVIQLGYTIYTPVTFSTVHVLVDRRPQPVAAYVTEGGRVGHDQITIDPYPQLADGGHDVIVFGPGNEPGVGKVAKWLIVYDAFPVDAQGNVVLQHAGSPNEPGPGQPQPAITLPLSSLEQQLAACH
jgi:hypothetical protein